mmetsp:Transcript_7183/g.14434  ORF Transcript_7183/g.14434 Transcript_7183/m.14434 type:complete len:207 (+) Transcript_7183:142-762(+)
MQSHRYSFLPTARTFVGIPSYSAHYPKGTARSNVFRHPVDALLSHRRLVWMSSRQISRPVQWINNSPTRFRILQIVVKLGRGFLPFCSDCNSLLCRRYSSAFKGKTVRTSNTQTSRGSNGTTSICQFSMSSTITTPALVSFLCVHGTIRRSGNGRRSLWWWWPLHRLCTSAWQPTKHREATLGQWVRRKSLNFSKSLSGFPKLWSR